MNYSWIAYENALQELPKRISPEYGEHEGVSHLQSELMRNIKRALSEGDTSELCAKRKVLVVELDRITKQQVEGAGFIELGIASSPVLGYLTSVYQTAQYAYSVFSAQRVWPIQCQDIVEQFGKRPLLDNSIASVSVTTQSSLRYIDKRISSFVQLIEDFEKRCPRQSHKPSPSLQSKQAEIMRKLKFFVMEVQTTDASSFEEFMCIWHECAHTSSPANDATENGTSSPDVQADVIESESEHQAIDQKPEHEEEKELSEIDVAILPRVEVGEFCKDDQIILQERGIDRKLYNQLEALLLKVPGIEDFDTRSALLGGIPNRVSLPRNYANAHTDIAVLIKALKTMQLQDKEWALLIFIDNALTRLDGTMDGQCLEELRSQIEVSLENRKSRIGNFSR